MRAIAVLPQSRELQLIECEMPAITSPTQVKLHMLDVGVCGTDRVKVGDLVVPMVRRPCLHDGALAWILGGSAATPNRTLPRLA